ncbi:MAG: hypothetical protein A2848_03390 [Candidatus Magasanikbacteria bacterium RIFCSPHIGHO2_01_FULL_50_8]|uniref:Uncharacterized protein n=2 Tax=Candidatus Magasanikiibacteriota TaxID=1752731 RepID=A0A1F6LN40_9BACT|nr:MAG: hypothetical protein A2848_03390 [Candidatus Magasanikbacteria bacterium RIFCSPHIGHO2_01_FULL_50_8]OGH67658.1 MAG: hypothetical protein A3C15_02495 [Candidatus Magasanikbacteria bacterium RIFCSPHIGHO2_02_FULL_50_9b]
MTQLLHQNILTLFGFTATTSQQTKNELMSRLIELVEKRVLVKILDRMTAVQQEEFLRILEIGTDEEKTVFLQSHVPDVARLIDSEVVHLKQQAHNFGKRFSQAAA